MADVPHLLLLHGALGSSSQLEALAGFFDGTHRVHRLDFEGHGGAPPRGRPFRIQHFVEDVLEQLDHERIEGTAIFGYSMGGYVALSLALSHPDRVDRVATLGTKFRWDQETAARESARLDANTIRSKVPRFADTLAARHERAGGWEAVLENTAEFLRDLGANPALTTSTLERLAVPVRVIVGDRDDTVSVEESVEIARALPAGELAVLPRTPHPIEHVDFTSLMQVLSQFLSAPGVVAAAPSR